MYNEFGWIPIANILEMYFTQTVQIEDVVLLCMGFDIDL
jgi:hypothetical protein